MLELLLVVVLECRLSILVLVIVMNILETSLGNKKECSMERLKEKQSDGSMVAVMVNELDWTTV